MNRTSNRINLLILVHHGLGDVIMALPLLVSLRNCSAVSSITVVVKSDLEADVIQLLEYGRRVRIIVLNERGSSRKLGLMRCARTLLSQEYDCFLAPHGEADCPLAIVSLLINASISVGPGTTQTTKEVWTDKPFFDRQVFRRRGEHKTSYYMEFGKKAGFGMDDQMTGDEPYSAVRERLEDCDLSVPEFVEGEYVVFAPGSGRKEAHKRWPALNYSQLAEGLVERIRECSVIVVGSDSERELVERIKKKVDDSRAEGAVQTAVGLTLPLLFGLIREAACVIGGCTGPIHVASLFNVPVVGLYGPTNPGFTGPSSGRSRVIRLGLPCSPCYRPEFIMGCGNPLCMKLISVQEVLMAVTECLRGKRPTEEIPWVETNHNAWSANLG